MLILSTFHHDHRLATVLLCSAGYISPNVAQVLFFFFCTSGADMMHSIQRFENLARIDSRAGDDPLKLGTVVKEDVI